MIEFTDECCVPFIEVGKCACGVNQPIEPTDAELAEIESELDAIQPYDCYN